LQNATVGLEGITGEEAGVSVLHGHAGSEHLDLDAGALGVASAKSWWPVHYQRAKAPRGFMGDPPGCDCWGPVGTKKNDAPRL
jgi:hypothetical protein